MVTKKLGGRKLSMQHASLSMAKHSGRNPYGDDCETFLSSYLSALKEDDPKMLDFFVAEAKKRHLIRPQEKSPLKSNNPTITGSNLSSSMIYGQQIVSSNKKHKLL